MRQGQMRGQFSQNILDISTLNTRDGIQLGLFQLDLEYSEGSLVYVFDAETDTPMLYWSLRAGNLGHYPPTNPVWWQSLVLAITLDFNIRKETIPITSEGQTFFTLTDAPIRQDVSELNVNGRTWSYGTEYTIGAPTPATITFMNSDYGLSPSDDVNLIYYY